MCTRTIALIKVPPKLMFLGSSVLACCEAKLLSIYCRIGDRSDYASVDIMGMQRPYLVRLPITHPAC